MGYITLANANKIISQSDINELDLEGEIYHIPIYFFSKYEKNELLGIQELLKDPKKYFTEIYQPYESVDTYSYVYEGRQPAYHKSLFCPKLQSNYQNFEIPDDIKDKGPETIKEFREWFEKVKTLLDKPDVFVARLQARWGIVTNPKVINKENSGAKIVENLKIEELEPKIDRLIKEAGRFYYKNEKNKEILKKFSKIAGYLVTKEMIYDNDTGYSEEDIKELLKFYDNKFKRPIKKYLIEYYKLKFNPEIEMEGYLLDRLGFNSCRHCHDSKYEPDNNKWKNDTKIINAKQNEFSEKQIQDSLKGQNLNPSCQEGYATLLKWVNDKHLGPGTYTFADLQTRFGEWVNDKHHAQGTLTYANGDKYKGEWKDDMIHGQGTYTFDDFAKYSRECRDVERHGLGTNYWKEASEYHNMPAGSQYEGQWLNGKKHGYGKATYADGTVKEGLWKDGDFIR